MSTTKTWTTPLPVASTCRACLNGGLLHRLHHRTRRFERWVRVHLTALRMPRVRIPLPTARLGMPRRLIAARWPQVRPAMPQRLAGAKLPGDLWKRTEHLRFALSLVGMVALFYAMSQYRTL